MLKTGKETNAFYGNDYIKALKLGDKEPVPRKKKKKKSNTRKKWQDLTTSQDELYQVHANPTLLLPSYLTIITHLMHNLSSGSLHFFTVLKARMSFIQLLSN